MLTTLLVALCIAAIQVVTYKLTGQRVKSAVETLEALARNAATSANAASAQAGAAVALLAPAVAQLPKTRSKKTVASGIGETETPVEEASAPGGDK